MTTITTGTNSTITHVPTTKEERLREILVRQFHVDIQVDMYAFACFVTAFSDVPGFLCMPWKVREEEYHKYSGIFVTSRTLSNWCRKLIEQGIMCKGSEISVWDCRQLGCMDTSKRHPEIKYWRYVMDYSSYISKEDYRKEVLQILDKY